MPSTHDEFSQLFRTLGTGNASLPAQPATDAHEAAQRWPLLGALPPQKPASIPALTEVAKQQRSGAQRLDAPRHKPALTLPGVGDRLAFNLNKMTSPQSPVRYAARAPAAPHPVAEPALQYDAPQPMTPPERRSPFSRMRSEAPQTHAAETKPGLFANGDKATSMPAADDCSLAGVFARLGHQEEEPARGPTGNRLSFLGRLGKR